MNKDVSGFPSSKDDGLIVFFGDKQHEISIREIKQLRHSESLKKLVNDHGLKTFIVLDQTHGSQGVCVEETDDLKNKTNFESWFEYKGDFIVTNKKNCALVVLTADCIPLVLYDKKKGAIGIVHAGWKGTANGVVFRAIEKMQHVYGTSLKDVQCFFGWSAGDCCYEVTSEFLEHFKNFDYGHNRFIQKQNKIFFNNRLHVCDGLKKFGIQSENIYTTNELCTICNIRFCSARREKEHAGRQVTFVALN